MDPAGWPATVLEATFAVLIIAFVLSLLELNGSRLNRVANTIFALIMGEVVGVSNLLIAYTRQHLEVRLALASAVMFTALAGALIVRTHISHRALASLARGWID